ncbi:olfactory receptor 146-like [Bufo gargarizans]|uniref:olfactory receptor 146-like n=1 Tax=Bufo gargarizans TaxID=30331 RepID=UPI001CF2444B|nr:olfactory receptor 146-like [Bufo gargarizans]
MSSSNHTLVMFFFLTGISNIPELQLPVFLLVFLSYLITLVGNITIFLLVCLDHHLHTPMYFFLCNLSILDMSSSTVTMHRIFVNFITGDTTISFFACMTQMYIFASLTSDELLLLTIMSYDRYMAICSPLRYHTVMCLKFCSKLTAFCWVVGFLQVLPLVVMLSRITCFKTTEINHFFCDIMPLIRLPCEDISTLELYNFINGLILAVFPFFLTFIPYIFIVIAILKIRSSTGRRKTFYTCSSHLTVIILLYTSLVCQYLQPDSMVSKGSNKLYSLFNTAAVPMLNPLIYSLKNKDVKEALKRRRRTMALIN